MQADIFTVIILPLALFIIMLGMGLSLKPIDFIRVLNNPKAISIGIICQMLILPLLSYLVIVLVGLKQELAVGLMLLAFCPGGTTSNFISYLARGDVALSISLSAIISLITPFTIPLLTVLMIDIFLDNPQTFELPLIKTIVQLTVITIVPVCVSMLINHKRPTFALSVEKSVRVFSIAFLFIIIAGMMYKSRADLIEFFSLTGTATLALIILSLSVGYFTSKLFSLKRKQAITIGIEVGIQNGTIALFVSGSLLGNTLMTIPAITYSLLMFVVGGGFAWLVSRR
ncbi:bile acid:sodium symporter family protein [Moritella viscosa]|uniref:Bile acid:Na+ symporter (BASS) family transporter n=1 Tax=Moritella viscosa TaxID=80854 RepID=A0ABY1HJ17_9GAMM|nr:bile acid:sodium symporter family protein [Moritella viscosa]SGZ02370.1 Bile acid:Na+ symporter (BASS) family transporter [Moritella viscosa]SGZ16657.1 Bile acid:Na+ symporter (BASS) family transporter [Moritella viscosa]SHO28251.1 Bile acid:Na+ symporter (BASS) family transporter [Moritella viscosa]